MSSEISKSLLFIIIFFWSHYAGDNFPLTLFPSAFCHWLNKRRSSWCFLLSKITSTNTNTSLKITGGSFNSICIRSCPLVTCGTSSLDHLILVVGNVSRQAAGEEDPNELEERNPKRDSCDDPQVGLHHVGHQCEAAHCVHLFLSLGHITQALLWALGVFFTAAERDALHFEVSCISPVSVVFHPTAMQSPLDGVNCSAARVIAVVGDHCVFISNT